MKHPKQTPETIPLLEPDAPASRGVVYQKATLSLRTSRPLEKSIPLPPPLFRRKRVRTITVRHDARIAKLIHTQPILSPEALIGLDGITHLVTGGEAPWFKNHRDVGDEFACLKNVGRSRVSR